MAVINWKDVYNTGIVSLDKEHQVLVEQINTLFEAIRDKRGDTVVGEVMTTLEDYTERHFQHEEQLMAEYDYPGLDEQRQIHQSLRDTLQQMKERNKRDPVGQAPELLKFLREWLLEHIVAVDKKYGAYLESRGGRFIS